MGGRLSRGRQRGLEQAVPLASPHTGLSWRDRRGGSPAGWGLVFTVATVPTLPNSQQESLQGQGLPHLCNQTHIKTCCFCPCGPTLNSSPLLWQDQPEWALRIGLGLLSSSRAQLPGLQGGTFFPCKERSGSRVIATFLPDSGFCCCDGGAITSSLCSSSLSSTAPSTFPLVMQHAPTRASCSLNLPCTPGSSGK